MKNSHVECNSCLDPFHRIGREHRRSPPPQFGINGSEFHLGDCGGVVGGGDVESLSFPRALVPSSVVTVAPQALGGCRNETRNPL